MSQRPSFLQELVGPALIAMLAAGLVATFAAAFVLSADGGGEEEAVGEVTSTETTGPPAEGELTIAMIPTIKFDQVDITIKAGEPVTILADNRETGVPHNFAVYTDESAQELLGGTEICVAPCQDTVTLELVPGIYFFRCDVHPVQMVGTLVVE